jgi:hypothetical protein
MPYTASLSGSTILSVVLTGLFLAWSPGPVLSSPWLAPSPQEEIRSDWVQDVARAFEKSRFRNVFMNQPFGCDQCAIIRYLNHAAEAMEHDQPKLAKSFIRRALDVLEEGREEGYYTEWDVRPIKRLILKKANQGFEETGAQLTLSAPRERRDPRYEQEGRDPLFSRQDEADEPRPYRDFERLEGSSPQDRHTRQYDQPSRKSMDRDRQQDRQRDRRRQQRDSDMARGDRSYDAHQRAEQGGSYEQQIESRQTREGRDRFPEDMTSEEALEALMEEEERDQQG